MDEQQKSRLTNYIGISIILILVYFWMQYALPPKSETPPNTPDPVTNTTPSPTPTATPPTAGTPTAIPDSVLQTQLAGRLGAFASAGIGAEQTEVLENELLRIEFSSKGGQIRDVLVKNYQQVRADSQQNEIKSPLHLMNDAKNRMVYALPVNGAANGKVSTDELYFQFSKQGNTLVARATAANGGYFEQSFTLQPNAYQLDYAVSASNLQNVLTSNQLQLNWDNYLGKLEKNDTYERTMSSVYYRNAESKSTDYCDCRNDDQDALGSQPVKWFSHSNQFFNTTLIGKDFNFTEFTGTTKSLGDKADDLKLLQTTALLPLGATGAANMTIYVGPNEFDRLQSYNLHLEDIIPFGSSFLGTINRWIVHPLFAFLLKLIGSAGIVILLLTLVVKLVLYPLTYKMVHGQAKMAALKPQLDALRKKFGDDQQQMSVESMKLYSEYGVNPLSGCLPVFLQMPIWLALYRFFPAAIEFRQASFLWATDLSSYDVAFKLPFHLIGFGNHISLFTIIWVVTTLWYTWYSMKQMDNAAMNTDQAKMMKYMQYSMPVIFMFFFNTFAAGLTCYLCFSNLLNVGQTVITKKFLINNDKIAAQLQANKNKPKKTGGWRDKFEQAMKEQQRLQEERAKQQKKK
jgi:YidC/Oxa1 family membrane protein insertase